jgi:site-specific DNA recombinase
MKKAVIYTRVSTEEQTKSSHLSLGVQEVECRKRAEALGFSVVKHFSDPGKSGGDFKRPGLIEMMNYVSDEKNKIEAVITLCSDRLARDVILHKTLMNELKKKNVQLKFVNGVEFEDTPEGTLIDTIFASLNQFHKDNTAFRTMQVIKSKVLSGFYCSRVPLGYKNIRDKEDRAGIIVDKDTAPFIKEIFELYSTGNYSGVELRDIMHKRGLRSYYRQKLDDSKIYYILKNPFYYGKVKWGDIEVEKGIHTPLITKELFDACQGVMKTYTDKHCHRCKHDFLLRGFIFCHSCGSRYTAEFHYNKRIGYYHCCKRQECNNRVNIEYKELEKKVENLFKRLSFSDDFIQMIIDEAKIEYKERMSKITSQKDLLQGQKSSLEAKRTIAENKLLNGTLDDNTFTRIKNEINKDIDGLDLGIYDVEQQRELDIDFIQEVLRFSKNIYEAYIKAEKPFKRRYINFFWDKIEVFGKDIKKANASPLFEELIKLNKLYVRAQKSPSEGALTPEIIQNNNNIENAQFAPIIAYHKTLQKPEKQSKVIISHSWGGYWESNPDRRDHNPLFYR